MVKHRKTFVRVIAIILVLLMVFSVLYSVVGTPPARAYVTQSQIDALKKQEGDLADRQSELQSEINSLQYEQSTTAAKKKVLDQQIALTEEEIALIIEQIANYEVLIQEKAQEVTAAQAREEAQWGTYKSNIRRMEEQGSITYLALIFDASDFTDLLSRIDLVDSIMKSDENDYARLQNARLATQEAKAALEQAKFDMEAKKVEQEGKIVILAERQAEAQQLLIEIENNLAAVEALEAELADERADIQADINKKVAELERQRQAELASGNNVSHVVGSRTLAWPTSASNKVTSEFGMRWHPVLKVYRSHSGVDIRTGYGAAILAADSGTVITSTYSSSYGNYVVVSHGNGMSTLYAHMSSLSVKVGQDVSKGQQVGKSGSTGISSGPHLHFEVIVSGTRVNPLNYFTGYEILD